MAKLILGTANFGQKYGIANDSIPSIKELEKIASTAWDGDIRTVHFSWQYNLPYEFGAIFKDFQRISKIESKPDWFRWNWKLGLSVYKPEDIPDPLCGIFDAQYEMIQFPLNILDNRFLKYGWLKMLKGYKIETFARSVFLQGLLLIDEYFLLPNWIPNFVIKRMSDFRKISKENNLQPYEAALGWVLGLKDVDYVIVGVNSAEQLKQLLEVKPLQWDYDFSIQDENVLDPNRWPNKEKERIEFLRKHNSINYG